MSYQLLGRLGAVEMVNILLELSCIAASASQLYKSILLYDSLDAALMVNRCAGRCREGMRYMQPFRRADDAA